MLAERGHASSRQKLHYGKDQVEHLGRVLQKETRGIPPSQVEGVSKAAKPTTVRQMMTFLGMTICITGACMVCGTIKTLLQQAPVLAQPDYSQPF